MEYCVFLMYLTSYTLENVQPIVHQACHQVGDILGSAAAAQKGKNMYFYYHSFAKSVKLRKECSGVWSKGRCQEKTLSPCYCDSYSLVSSQSCLQTHTRRDKWAFQRHGGFCLHREGPGSRVEYLLKSLQDQKLFDFPTFSTQKNVPIFQEKTFSIRRNTKIRTPNTWNSKHRMTPSSPSCIWCRFNCSYLLGFSKTLCDFNLKSIPPPSIWKLNWL